MAIELPEDAEGRNIPPGAEVPYGRHGLKDDAMPPMHAVGNGACGGDGGHAGIECPDCGGRADSHAGHTGNGRVLACGEGKPPVRGAAYRRRHCGPTAIFTGKCGLKGVGHD